MIDLNKLNSQLDLKNLDIAQIIKIVNEQQNNIIKFALIIGSLLAAVMMFNNYHGKDQVLHVQISQLQQKLDAIKTRDGAIKQLDAFKASLSDKINEFELLTLISDYSRTYHISIPSLAPADSQDMGLYDDINISFNATADNFRDMMMFLRKIEKSKYPLRIDSWSGQQQSDDEITFKISISAVLIHE